MTAWQMGKEKNK